MKRGRAVSASPTGRYNPPRVRRLVLRSDGPRGAAVLARVLGRASRARAAKIPGPQGPRLRAQGHRRLAAHGRLLDRVRRAHRARTVSASATLVDPSAHRAPAKALWDRSSPCSRGTSSIISIHPAMLH